MTDSELNEKLNNDFKAFRIEHDNRIAQKYVEQIPGKGLSEENFTPQEKNKLASLTGGADIDTSQFATKDELQTALDNVTIDTSPFATKTELQTAISNVAIDSLSSNDVYIPAATYNAIMWEFNVASASENVSLTEFLTVWTGKVVERLNLVPMGEYTAEDIRNAALNVSQASRDIIAASDITFHSQNTISSDVYDLADVVATLEHMEECISGTFITSAPLVYDSSLYSTGQAFAIKMADVFLQYLKTNRIAPTTTWVCFNGATHEIHDNNLAWFSVIANNSFEKLTADNLADATELYACIADGNEISNSESSEKINLNSCVIGSGLFVFAIV